MPTATTAQIETQAVLDFFGPRAAGFFIEVGANDPVNGSQTWPLEQRGWSGLLVEPMQRHYDQLVAARPRSRVVHAACTSPENRGMGALHLAPHSVFNSLRKNVDDLSVEYVGQETVPLVTLDDLLAAAPPARVDFVSIDVEGTELDVLKGFDLQRWKPELVLIEDKVNTLHKHRHLTRHGYRFLRRVGFNGWYVPQNHPAQTSSGDSLRHWRKYYLGLPLRKLRHARQMRRLKQS